MFETPPILMIIFRRPDTTRRVFEAIREARPSRLFVAADGPRAGRAEEAELCRQTRAVVEGIDWPCELHTRFLDQNQGIQAGPSGAITWFFSHVEEGIILEDDCLPHPDFFRYCGDLLERYRHDTRVFHIGGNNFESRPQSSGPSYYFTRYNHIWGWATWKRAWDCYRSEFQGLEPFLAEARRTDFWDSDRERRYWTTIFRRNQQGRIVTWDYAWTYTLWAEGAHAISPRVNLVRNIGFGAGGIHQFETKDEHGQRPLEPLGPVVPNPLPLRNRTADRRTFQNRFWGSPHDRLQLRMRQLSRLLRKGKK